MVDFTMDVLQTTERTTSHHRAHHTPHRTPNHLGRLDEGLDHLYGYVFLLGHLLVLVGENVGRHKGGNRVRRLQ